MSDLTYNNRRSTRTLANIIWGIINAFLSQFVGKTKFSRIIFDFFGRVLPIPQTIVRGVPIKIIIPLNQIGVFNTFKDWEKREPEVLDWIDSFAPGCIFFDIGASFGTETLYAALKKNGPIKIVSFDLSLASSFNLAYNLSLNNIKNVEQYFIALSDGVKLHSFSEPTQYYFVKGREKYDTLSFNTISISLDQFIKMTHLFPDYIKIDVDGAEQCITIGMSETVQNKKLKSVVVEVSDKSEPVITDFFEKAGFMVELERRLAEEGETTFKNIIFTRKKSPATA
jgi:FkbM family methyltransferase